MIRITSPIALFLSLLLIVPLQPAMPFNGIDPSWAWAVNEAVADRLVFGRDFVFTFGPLGSMVTRLFHPETDFLMLSSALVFGIGFCVAFAALAAPDRQPLAILLFLAIAASITRDSLFMVLPFLVLLLTVRICLPREDPRHLACSFWPVLALVASACATAISPLSKSSHLGPVLANLGLVLLLLLCAGRRIAATALLAILICSVCLAWILTGQPLDGLVTHLVLQGQLISGYTSAMSLHGDAAGLVTFVLGAAGLSICLYWGFARLRGLPGLAAVTGLLLLLFVLFKAGFVRHDSHQVMPAHALLLLGLMIAAVADKRRTAIGAVTIGFACWLVIERLDTSKWPVAALQIIAQQTNAAAQGIMRRLADGESLEREYQDRKQAIRKSNPLPTMRGTVDLYPSDVAILFAHDLAWSGRPSVQSYAAYTPALDGLNAAHLSGPRAPDNVLFSLAPIDGRLPTLEDAASLPVLLSRYEVADYAPPYIHMARRDAPLPSPLDTGEGEVVARGQLNIPIAVPASEVIWAAIDVQPTLLGRIVLTLYKLPGLRIALTLGDGSVARYRYIPNMGSTGFLLSPLLSDTEHFLELAAGARNLPQVVSVQVETPDIGLWDPEISVRFAPMKLKAHGTARSLTMLSPVQEPAILRSQEAKQGGVCDLDVVQGKSATMGDPIVIQGTSLSIRGWAAVSPAEGIAADAVWLELRAPDGQSFYFAPRSFPRPDVAGVYGHDELQRSGYVGNLDLSGLPTSLELRIRLVRNDATQDCGVPTPVKVLAPGDPKGS
jgi:hypothetical protein